MKHLLEYNKRKLILLLTDFLCIILSCIVSFFLLNVVRFPIEVTTHFNLSVLCFAVMSVIFMYIMKAYKIVWRYAYSNDFIGCIMAVVTSVLIAVVYFSIRHQMNMMFYYVISGIMSILAVCFIRIVYIILYKYIKSRAIKESKNRVMIIGAGDAGKHICDLMKVNDKYNPVVFIDDDSGKIGRTVNGIMVKGNTNEIPKIVKELNVHEIVLAIPSIDRENKKRVLNICSETLCKVNILPDLDKYVYSEKLHEQMTEIKIEDLLGRDVVEFNSKPVQNMVRDTVCMITGGGGSIGSELTRQIAEMKPKLLIIVDIYENNAYDIQQELMHKFGDNLNLSVQIASVRDYVKMNELFSKFKPQIVFHAAAHKHVPLMETNPEEAVKNNIFGTLNVARLAREYEAEKFVLVSTDKAVNPTNIMGATKRCCEMIIECMAQSKSKTEFVAVRFGNVLGSNGSVIPLFKKQILDGGPVTVTDPKIIRYFMTIPEAASLILQASTMARGGEIFILDMGDPVKILDLAENLIRLHGYEPYKDIDIVFTGLRPGEKLYEELLMNEEGIKNTANNKIFIGKQININEEIFFANLDKLEIAAKKNDKGEVERMLHIIVPTFIRNNQETGENKEAIVK